MHNDRHTLQRYLAEIAHIPTLAGEQEQALVEKLPGRASEDALIQHYLPVVVQVARLYRGQGVPLLQLIAAGNVCLVQAIRSLRPVLRMPLRATLNAQLRKAMEHCIISQVEQSLPLVDLHALPSSQEAHANYLFHHTVYPDPGQALLAQEAWNAVVLTLLQFSDVQRLSLACYFGFTGQ